MKLNLSKNNQESANVQNAQVMNPTATAIVPTAPEVVDAEYEEVTEEPETPQRKMTLKRKVMLKRKVKIRKKVDTNEPEQKKDAQYYHVTYQTKHGGTGSYVMGFKTEQEAKVLADNACKTVNATWRYNDKGEKVYALALGSRYLDIAKRLCDALNKGDKAAVSKAIAETHDVYAAAVEAGRAEREAKRKAKKAEEDKAKAEELAKVKKANGLYSMTEIAAMMQRAMAGEDVPELKAVKEAMGLAA